MGDNDIGVLLENGDLYIIDIKDIPKEVGEEHPIENFPVQNIEGTIVKVSQDKKENKFVLIYHKNGDRALLSLLFQGKVF